MKDLTRIGDRDMKPEKPDAMDLARIGREMLREFTVGDFGDDEGTQYPRFRQINYCGPHLDRDDADRLVELLGNLGFRIVKEDPCA